MEKDTRFTFWLVMAILVLVTVVCEILLNSRTFNPLILQSDYDVLEARQEYEDQMLNNTFHRFIKPYAKEQGLDKN